MKYKTLIIVSLFTYFLNFNSLNAQKLLENKEISRAFKANAETSIEIYNKYGKINLIPWEKDSLKINIEFKIRAKNQDKLNKIKENVDFEFEDNGHYIIARTVMDKNKGSLLSEITNLAEAFVIEDNSVEINYEVYYPEKASVKLNNKFGDIYTGDIEGDIDIDLSYGNLKAHNFNGNTNITLKFGDGSINYVKSCKLTLSYSDVNIKTASKIHVSSKSGKVEISKIVDLKAISKRDRYIIGTVNQLYMETSFTDVSISLLEKKLTADFKYGNINIALIPKDFTSMKITSKYSDIGMCFIKDASYQLTADYSKTSLSYPNDLPSTVKTILIDEKSSTYKATGTIGTDTDTQKSVTIRSAYDNISITHK